MIIVPGRRELVWGAPMNVRSCQLCRLLRLVVPILAYVPLLCIVVLIAPYLAIAPFLREEHWRRLHFLLRELRGWSREILVRWEAER